MERAKDADGHQEHDEALIKQIIESDGFIPGVLSGIVLVVFFFALHCCGRRIITWCHRWCCVRDTKPTDLHHQAFSRVSGDNSLRPSDGSRARSDSHHAMSPELTKRVAAIYQSSHTSRSAHRRLQHTPHSFEAGIEMGTGRTSGVLAAARVVAVNTSAQTVTAGGARNLGENGDAKRAQRPLNLDSKPVMDPRKFEADWSRLQRQTIWGCQLSRPVSEGEIERVLKASRIFCIASGSVKRILKYYFYAIDLSANDERGFRGILMIEASVSVDTGHLSAIFKTEEESRAQLLIAIFRRTLERNGLLAQSQ
jgi:hypothetical protein